jgi:hypothetical protein
MNSLGAENGTDLALREALPLVRASAVASLCHRTDCRLTKLPPYPTYHRRHQLASLPRCHPPLLRIVVVVLIAGGY